MKKNLAKKVTLSILAGAVLFTTGSVWAADVTGQTTIIDSGIHDQIINGAKISGGTDSATYNTVKVSGDSTFVNSIINGAFISGGGTGNVNSNAVEISGGTLNSDVYGGQTYGSGDANYNTVTISGGTFDGSGQLIYGGYTGSGDAKGNVINISGGTFSSGTMIVAASAGSGSANDNTINLFGNPNLKNVDLHGRLNKTDSGTNNVLNIKFTNSTGNNIKSIKYFDVINFDNLTWNPNQSESVIKVENADLYGAQINAWITNNINAMGKNQAMTLIENTSGTWGSGIFDATNSKVYIGVSNVATDDAIIAMDSEQKKVQIVTKDSIQNGSAYVPSSQSLIITKDASDKYNYKVNDGTNDIATGTADNVVDLVGKLSPLGWAYEIGGSAYIGRNRTVTTVNNTVKLDGVELVFQNPYNTGSMLVGSYFNNSTDKLENNKVIINNSTFGGGNVYGALAQAEATGNSVEITDSGVTGNIYGAKVETGTASGNSVSVSVSDSGNSELAGDIYGARAKGDASENKVTITGGEVYGDYIYGGYSETGKASGNVITIDGGTIGNASNTTQIYAGDTGVSGGAIENNIINLSGAPDLKNAELHAGSKVGTGNVLNVGYDSKAWTKGGEIKDIRKFNVINFNNLAWEKGATVVKTS